MISMGLGLQLGGGRETVGLALFGAGLIGMAWFSLAPPAWAKPKWLIEGETSGRWPIQRQSAFDVFFAAVIGLPGLMLLVGMTGLAIRG